VEEGGGVEAENWEEERGRFRIGSLKKKALNASSRFTHSLKKRGKRKIDFRVPIEDVRDAKEESAVQELRQRLLQKGFMPPNHDDYHALLRSFFFSFLHFLITFSHFFLMGILVGGRFLKARDFNMEKTMQMWEEMLIWRKEFGTDAILKVIY